MHTINKKKTFIPAALFLLLLTGFLAAEEKVIEIRFKEPAAEESDQARTLKSMVRVREISEQYATGGLYLLTHYGDYEELFEKENPESWEKCFVVATDRKLRIRKPIELK